MWIKGYWLQVSGYWLQVAGCRLQVELIVGTFGWCLIRLNMGSLKSFEEFEVWQTSREITFKIYDLTKQNAFAGDFGLKNQIRRASISVMSNIAEGHESQTKSVFIRHLGIAKGSAGEVRSQLYVAFDQKYITEVEFNATTELCKKASRQIAALMHYLKSCP
jgi:four helix bundle protein